MYQTIHEAISMAGIYQNDTFKPVKFRWRHQLYEIEEVASVHDFKDGSILKRRFSVMSKGTLYLIEFDRHRESWMLEQLWINQ